MQMTELAPNSPHIETIAEWFHAEWAHLNPGRTISDVISVIENTIKNENESAFAIFLNNSLIGAALLREKEVTDCGPYTPWLSSLTIKKSMRKKGFGSLAVKLFEEHCKKRGFDIVFLFTESLGNWYQGLGWHIAEKTSFKDHRGVIMTKTLR